MKRFHVSRAVVAAMVGIVAVPTLMSGVFTSSMSLDAIHQRAVNDVRRVRDLRRDYWEAVDVYNSLREIGFDAFRLEAPDINNIDSIKFYLDSSNFDGSKQDDELHGAAMEKTAEDEYNELSERYRDFIDGYIAAGYCPDTLKQFHLSGMYELCTRMLDERIASIELNLIERSEMLRRSASLSSGRTTGVTLKDRLRLLEDTLLQTRKGGMLRPTGSTGQTRPRLDTVQ